MEPITREDRCLAALHVLEETLVRDATPPDAIRCQIVVRALAVVCEEVATFATELAKRTPPDRIVT